MTTLYTEATEVDYIWGLKDINVDMVPVELNTSGGTNLTQKGRSIDPVTFNCQLYRFIMSVCVTGTLCIFGTIGNILILLVFRVYNLNSSDIKNRSSAPLLLSGLALSDLLLLISLFILFLLLKSILNFLCPMHLLFLWFMVGPVWVLHNQLTHG